MLALLRQRNVALLWVGALISQVGDYVLLIGLPLRVYTLTHSTLASGLMFMTYLAPQLALGTVAGVFVDRWDRRATMIVCNLGLALGLLPLLAVHSAAQVWLVFPVCFLLSCIAQFANPAENALLPLLVREDQLVAANALTSLRMNLTRLGGPPLGGAIAASVGLPGVALADATSFLAAALLTLFIAVPVTASTVPGSGSAAGVAGAAAALWREWRAGLSLIREQRTLATIFAVVAITGVGEGIFLTLYVPFVTKVLGGGGREYGWMVSSQAVGGLVGSLIVGRLFARADPRLLLGLASMIFGLIDLTIFNYHSVVPGIVPGLVLMAIVGVPGAGFGIAYTTLLQTASADAYRGRIFGALGATAALVALIGTLLAGVLGDSVGIVPVLNIQGLGYLVAGLMALILLRSAGP